MTKHTLPTIDYLRKRLRYEPETGKLFWLHADDMPKEWNTRWAGKESFLSKHDCGYRKGVIAWRKMFAHRVAWAIHYSEWPSDQIDHINGIRDDNRICNLRVVTNQVNSKNSAKKSNNTSGMSGVSWDKQRLKWLVIIMINGRNKYLGRFDSIEEATAARAKANIEYGFTDRHGKANVITSAPNT